MSAGPHDIELWQLRRLNEFSRFHLRYAQATRSGASPAHHHQLAAMVAFAHYRRRVIG